MAQAFGDAVKGTGELIGVQMNLARSKKKRFDFEQLLGLLTMGLQMMLAPASGGSWG